MINQVVLIGRTTKDIELCYTRSNKAYAKFSLAVNRAYKDEQGNQQADFIRIVVWGKQAENTAKYVKKGSLIGVIGRIETGSYENNGITHYTTDIVANAITFLETKKTITEEAGSQPYMTSMNTTNFNPFDPNFSNPNYANYHNPFDTATTRVGQMKSEALITINDDDLPY